MRFNISKIIYTALYMVSILLSACGGSVSGGLDVTTPKAWGTAELIETNPGFGSVPQIAIDANGNALAVWSQGGATINIWANRYTAGSGWGTAELIETDNAGSALAPQIAIDASGNALAVWYQSDGTRNNIWANRYTAGSGWGTAVLIETDNTGDALYPQIAIDANGNALAVWQQSDGTRFNIWANNYTVGSGWGTAVLIETDNAGDAQGPQIAIDANGNALAVWNQSDGTRLNIWANRYAVGSGWGTSELIETDNAGDAYWPQIAIDVNGNSLAVWHQYDGTRNNIWANRYTTGSGWGTAALIETNNAGDAYLPQIAIDASGNALAVWNQSDGTYLNIWSNSYTASTHSWGTATLIETGSGDASNPQVTINASGNALAVWQQYDGTRNNIVSNHYTAGSGWGSAAMIATDNSGYAYTPQIAIDASGKALAVWMQLGPSQQNIWANRFQ